MYMSNRRNDLKISTMLRKTAKRIAGEEVGFTILELMIVMVVSLIMLAGMVALLEAGFKTFSSGSNLQSVTDASRRVLPAIDREIKSILRINDQECIDNYKVASPDGVWNGVWNGMSFYSNVGNNSLGATTATTGTFAYTNAEKVELYLDNNHNLMQKTTYPAALTPPAPVNPATATLCSYVTDFKVYYFQPGVVSGSETPPSGTAPETPPSNWYKGTALNSGAGSVKVVITIQKGTGTKAITRTYEQTTFLRVLTRS